MEPLNWLQQRARRLCTRRTSELTEPTLQELEREHGAEARLDLRREVGLQLSGECFRAGLFSEAAEWFRIRLDATRELADHLAVEGDREGASREAEELARHAWAVGDLALFRRYVEEGCEPERGLRPRLEVLPALFLSWAVLRRRFHLDHWSRWLDETVELEAAELADRWEGEELTVARGLVLSSRRSLCSWWLGRFEDAGREAEEALEAFRRRGNVRPSGLALPHAREWRLRMEGLAALARARDDSKQLPAAVTALGKALAASALTRDVEWKDLVILHLTARSWASADDEWVQAFCTAFPHLSHLLDERRRWEDGELHAGEGEGA